MYLLFVFVSSRRDIKLVSGEFYIVFYSVYCPFFAVPVPVSVRLACLSWCTWPLPAASPSGFGQLIFSYYTHVFLSLFRLILKVL